MPQLLIAAICITHFWPFTVAFIHWIFRQNLIFALLYQSLIQQRENEASIVVIEIDQHVVRCRMWFKWVPVSEWTMHPDLICVWWRQWLWRLHRRTELWILHCIAIARYILLYYLAYEAIATVSILLICAFMTATSTACLELYKGMPEGPF